MNDHHIVVSDPSNEYHAGSIIDISRARQLFATRAVISLPVQPELFKMSGVGGYMKREWGAGFPLDAIVPRMFCPLTMYCSKEFSHLHWAARLVASETGRKHQGTLRLTADSSQASPLYQSLTEGGPPVDCSKLGTPDARGGWVVRGTAELQVQQPGHYAFAIYGAAPGLRVAWAAISLAAE